MENGEDVVGYQYLHETNADVGGFQRRGSATITRHQGGRATVTLWASYTWNDTIDPNPIYQTDTVKSTFAEVITLGRADPYDLHIGWDETTVLQLDEHGQVVAMRNDP